MPRHLLRLVSFIRDKVFHAPMSPETIHSMTGSMAGKPEKFLQLLNVRTQGEYRALAKKLTASSGRTVQVEDMIRYRIL